MKLDFFFEKYIKLQQNLDDSKIYKIVSNKTDKVYIGSTWKTLKDRLINHKCDYKRWLKNINNDYKTSYEMLELDDYKIRLIEDFPCTTKQDLKLREGYYIKELDCVNYNVAGRTKKETRAIFYENNKEYNKIYREKNKEEIAEKNSKYYENNKEKIQARVNEKCLCECGSEHRYGDTARHLRTIKHQNFINSL